MLKYDPHFSKYTKRYFGPGFDWRYFKAQAIAESHLKSDAVSHVGAKGVMQIMPRTFSEIKTKNPVNTAEELAKKNTTVGIVVGSIFIEMGIAIGFIIGMGLN